MNTPTIERHRAFWLHYQPNSDPYHERQINSDQQAIEFAKLLIQSLLFLHGGALLSFPVLVTFFTATVFNHQDTILAIMSLFALGIILALGAGISGFFAMANRADSYAQTIYARIDDAWAFVAQAEMERTTPDSEFDWPKWIEQLKRLEAEHEAKAGPLNQKFWLHRVNAIMAIVCSCACFVVVCGMTAIEILY